LFCTVFTHSSRVFPHRTDSHHLITTFSVGKFHIIGAASKVKISPLPISFATSTPGISESQTHLLILNQIAQSWCARFVVVGTPVIGYMLPGTQSTID